MKNQVTPAELPMIANNFKYSKQLMLEGSRHFTKLVNINILYIYTYNYLYHISFHRILEAA